MNGSNKNSRRKVSKSIFDDAQIVFKTIGDNIVHIKTPTKESLASAFVRFQEYYESPFEEIRSKIFTLGYLRSMGSRHNRGVYTYEGGNLFRADWSGYNFPSYVLEPFIKGLFDPLTPVEQDIVNALKCKIGRFYVIGTYGEDDGDGDIHALDHEICHALYYVNEDYKKEVDEVLSLYDLTAFKAWIKNMGYADTVLDDEAHAYISADFEWLVEDKKDDISKFGELPPESLHVKLREIKNKYFSDVK